MTTALISVLLAASINGNIVSVAPGSVPAAQVLCVPAIGVPDRLWGIADNLVEQREYQAAARAYYQLFRCATWTPISPLVADANQLEPFDGALRRAAEGKVLSATTKLKQIIKALPDFGEARFLMGVFHWSAGLHAEARAIGEIQSRPPISRCHQDPQRRRLSSPQLRSSFDGPILRADAAVRRK
jgi:hypothetical protein